MRTRFPLKSDGCLETCVFAFHGVSVRSGVGYESVIWAVSLNHNTTTEMAFAN